MKFDFSNINFEYLIKARDLAKEDLDLTALLLDMPNEVAQSLATVDSKTLVHLQEIQIPLLVPRHDRLWWTRLFRAFNDDNAAEIQAILAQGSLVANVVEELHQ